ncbi:MAG: hypothetical protein H6Q72_1893 [Firmicutes bacterium]|nr:hypothetical protein [Bacillota bacterium]
MSELQNLMHTIYFQLESLKSAYSTMTVSYGLPSTVPNSLVVAVEHDKTKVDEQYELSGYRKRPRVFVAEVYATTQTERNDVCEAIKDLFENKTLPIQDSARQAAGGYVIGDGVRVEVDLTQRYKARIKIYMYTLVN